MTPLLLVDLVAFLVFCPDLSEVLKAFFSQFSRNFLAELGSFSMKFGSSFSAGIINIRSMVLALINDGSSINVIIFL